MKPELNKWQFIFKPFRQWQFRERKYLLVVGAFKLTSWPVEGAKPSKDNYTGFLYELPLYRRSVYLKRKTKSKQHGTHTLSILKHRGVSCLSSARRMLRR